MDINMAHAFFFFEDIINLKIENVNKQEKHCFKNEG